MNGIAQFELIGNNICSTVKLRQNQTIIGGSVKTNFAESIGAPIQRKAKQTSLKEAGG